jgi:hypothetical protein
VWIEVEVILRLVLAVALDSINIPGTAYPSPSPYKQRIA